jgi:hypothetical protein
LVLLLMLLCILLIVQGRMLVVHVVKMKHIRWLSSIHMKFRYPIWKLFFVLCSIRSLCVCDRLLVISYTGTIVWYLFWVVFPFGGSGPAFKGTWFIGPYTINWNSRFDCIFLERNVLRCVYNGKSVFYLTNNVNVVWKYQNDCVSMKRSKCMND